MYTGEHSKVEQKRKQCAMGRRIAYIRPCLWNEPVFLHKYVCHLLSSQTNLDIYVDHLLHKDIYDISHQYNQPHRVNSGTFMY